MNVGITARKNVHDVWYNVCMDDKEKAIKKMLDDKRLELVWALSLQNYTQADIAYMLRDADVSTISRAIKRRPRGWKTKWVKQD